MTIGQVIVLAVTQGVTEFLPVSSSGHLVVVRQVWGISDMDGGPLDAFLHLGTLLALLIYYRRIWLGMAKAFVVKGEESRDKRQLAAKLAVATVPGALVGYLGKDLFETMGRSPSALAAGFLITAGLLVAADLASRGSPSKQRASFVDAALIGLAQVAALVPSISRSGVTIAAGCWRGLSRVQATTFSFLMSAPIIAGAGWLGLRGLLADHALTAPQLLVGFVFSFAAGYAAIAALMKWIQKVSFWPFVAYLLILSLVLWARF